jgi:tRNA threonylcarbamoyladenosine biosynthesis protein TsaB
MYLLLDTSTPTCKLTLMQGDNRFVYEWEAHRQLAHGLLAFLSEKTAEHGVSLSKIAGVGAYKGPGSFTGLRIGLTVVNTLADTKGLQIVGETGEQWMDTALLRLKSGENDQLVMPFYGAEAHITTPRK